MGKKAKASSASKATAKAQKKAKAAKAAEKKHVKAAKKGKGKDEAEDDDDDLEALLDRFKKEWEEQHAVFEEREDTAPSRRANATLTACPGGNDLWLIGGEYFDGDKCYFYNDVYRYSPAKNEWRKFSSKNQPGPRSAHQVVPSPAAGGKLWLFGGEFASLKQTNFHHYRDLWSFDISTLTWDRIDTKLRPSARSGHRMAMWKHYLVLFGGFHDEGVRTTYLDDLWIFDTTEYKWTQIKQTDHRPRPTARSGFSFLSCPDGIVLHGGYCKIYVKGQRAKGVALDDTWLLKMDNDVGKIEWVKRRKVGYAPSLRSGCTMALWSAKSMGVLFGGVHDDEKDEETLESVFYKDLFGYNLIGTGRWISFNLKKPKKKSGAPSAKKKALKAAAAAAAAAERERARREREAEERMWAEGEEEDASADDDDDRPLRGAEANGDDEGEDEGVRPSSPSPSSSSSSSPIALPTSRADDDDDDDPDDPQKTVPLERYNAMLAVQRNTLYIYGGIFETSTREYTLDSFHTLNLDKLDRFMCLKECRIDELEWNESDEEEGDDSSDDDDGGGADESEPDEPRGERRRRRGEEDEEEKTDESSGSDGEEKDDDAEAQPAQDGDAEAKADLRRRATAFLGVSKDLSRSEEDVLSTPAPGESLRAFYERTRSYWTAKAHGMSDNRGKLLRRDGFALAEERYNDYKPLLEEIERIQSEAGLDDDELRRSRGGPATAAGGTGVESRHRR